MSTHKLPLYAEKYFDQKFCELNSRIDDLKLHVNDELKELRELVEHNQKNIYRIWFAILALTPIYIKDSRDLLFSLFRGVFGI